VAQPVLALLQQRQPRIAGLALDDLHFADDASVELLQGLLTAPRDGVASAPRRCRQRAALVPGPAPRQPRAAASRHCWTHWPAAGPLVRVALQPLAETHMAELVDSLALPGVSGARTGPAAPAQRWQPAVCAGNAEAGVERRHHHAGRRPATPGVAGQLIGQQLARLSPAALQLARVAAVAGVDFSMPLAQALLPRNALELADAWAELEAQHVMRGDDFAHDLIHDAVLRACPR
jgi:hypothetical protein